MSPSQCISWQRTSVWEPAEEVSRHACKFNYSFVSILDDIVRRTTGDDRRNGGSNLGKGVISILLCQALILLYDLNQEHQRFEKEAKHNYRDGEN